MAILHAKKVWKKPPTPRAVDRVTQLTREEEASVLEAMRVVRMQKGSWDLVARSMRMTKRMLSRFVSGEAAPNAGIAIKIARLAGVSVDDVLSGRSRS